MLQPIDLQTLFAQLNKVGKMQAVEKESSILQQTARGNLLARQNRLRDESVNQTEELQDETGKVKEKQSENSQEKEKHQRGGRGKKDSHHRGEFSDPALGKNIDVSG